MHKTMTEYLATLSAQGRASTVPSYRRALQRFHEWLAANSLQPLDVTLEILQEFQRYLAFEYQQPGGRNKSLKKSTQATWLAALKAFYKWLYRRNALVFDPAAKLKLPKIRRSKVNCDHLNQQETIAFIETQARILLNKQQGTTAWAIEFRNLALLCMGIATGRRQGTLKALRVKDLDLKNNEVRTEWEKGRPGRVLPCAEWALDVAKRYIKTARPVLLAVGKREDPEWLFVGVRTDRICDEYLARFVKVLQAKTAEACSDLDELAVKKLSGHSLRVTFATMMFLNGAGIRVVNDLLLHRQLSTSAAYTPLELDDLRQACRLAHPRA